MLHCPPQCHCHPKNHLMKNWNLLGHPNSNIFGLRLASSEFFSEQSFAKVVVRSWAIQRSSETFLRSWELQCLQKYSTKRSLKCRGSIWISSSHWNLFCLMLPLLLTFVFIAECFNWSLQYWPSWDIQSGQWVSFQMKTGARFMQIIIKLEIQGIFYKIHSARYGSAHCQLKMGVSNSASWGWSTEI